ncbi:hypothetical protein BH09ACT4_BH09ACT4_14850 [soil metagenome]
MSEPSQPMPPGQPVPPVAPVPPVPPAPPAQPVPQYGEYAPAGYVAPTPAQPMQPVQPYGAASYPAYPAQPGVRRRKGWDLVLTIILLVVGLFGMLIGLAYAAIFSDPVLLDQGMQQQGLTGFNGTVGIAPQVIVISHVALYLLAVGGSIPLLIGKRVAFWVPLAAGVIAAIIFWSALVSVLLSDPAFVANYS